MKIDQKYIWGETKKIGHSRVEGLVHFYIYFMLICMETTLLIHIDRNTLGLGAMITQLNYCN